MSEMNTTPVHAILTTLLVTNIMARVARQLDLDPTDPVVETILYNACVSLEDWPEGEGFGSSDSYSQLKQVESEIDEIKSLFSDLWKDKYNVRPGLSMHTIADMQRFIDNSVEEQPGDEPITDAREWARNAKRSSLDALI